MFEDFEVISSYTRAQAFEDGNLVDVSTTAKKVGILWPVAITKAVWEDVVRWKREAEWETNEGRLWDLLWMLATLLRREKNNGSQVEIGLKQVLRLNLVNNVKGYGMVAHELAWTISGGDNGEPVLTVMMPNED